ncbi:aminoglycoside phosphotransferase family protein [Sphingobium sp. PAMC28499]|jgi:Ser/Thr protein kinase RdoA (MazF antagonist)|uniref:phosphotransferase family protein n=1 Tax=Sphingobium sp. PAMC28499 TaxID=2565554 RepID=UPI00109DF143|nr:aminoglycoside phosphotransferase family protein [Sphingobium sp. PAMC28499]QCB38413.1 aminoglycoside phosphotransferase family protein [Sphingobium sp. PAMC28499]
MSLPDPSTFIAEGASAAVYRLEGGKVLKLFHDGVDAGIIAREHATAQAIQATGLPVPRVFGRAEAGGRQGIIYSEIEGPNLLHHIVRHPHRIGWAMGAMAALQRAIHGHDLPALRSRKAILAEDIEMAPIGDRLRAAAIDRLDQLIEGDRLSHGDLHPANLIVSGDGLAVIDWSKAARSAPAADVVRSEMLMRFGPGQSGGRLEGMLRDATTAYYVGRYRKLAGMEPDALNAWRGLVGLAWLRHRLPGRDAAFAAYLTDALRRAGLPPLEG